MNITKTISLGVLVISLISCENFIEPYQNGDRSEDDIWKYPTMVAGLVGQCYDYMPRNYNDNEGAYWDCASDNAVTTSPTHSLRRFSEGTLTTGQDPFSTFWVRDYNAIRLVNMFLKDRRGFNTDYLRPQLYAAQNILVKRRLQGEAYALRAWFQWDLLQKFGGKGTNGVMLGFPIITEPLDFNGEINYARDTYDDCVKQIIADCDSAYAYLPAAHRNFLVPDPNMRTYAGGLYWGRMDGIITVALKAMVYLKWASPRFNPTNDVSRWDKAAKFAKQVMDFKLTGPDGPTGGGTAGRTFDPVKQMAWLDPNFAAIVFKSRDQLLNDDMERMFYPGGFQGNGVMGATQELVNSFPMANGYPINDPANRGNYNAANPYLSRDPRFYSVIFYNSSQAKKNNTSPIMYTFENWANGGTDASGRTSNNSLTNYHIKKFIHMGLNWADASPSRQVHCKVFIRWAHMCLTFAEAANQVVGPTDAGTYGVSAKTAIQYLRARKTYDGLNGISPAVPLAADAYLTEVANAGKASFNELVKNENRIETCFEGMRFYDLQRWTTNLTEMNKSVHGAGVTKNTDGTFTYDLNNFVVSAHSFTSAYLPIPYSEILRMSNLVQNEGWEAWQ